MKRRYVPEDRSWVTKLHKKPLVALIENERKEWPHKSFNPSKLNREKLYEALLDPDNAFTTTAPLPDLAPPLPDTAAAGPSSNNNLTTVAALPHPPAHPPTPSTHPLQGQDMVPPRGEGLPTEFVTANQVPVKRPLTVYIVDQRAASPPLMLSRLIEVAAVDYEGCNPGEWQASAIDIVEGLQASPSVIMGSGFVRLGVPDEYHPEYTRYFIEGGILFLTEVVADPDRLKISAESVLHIRIMSGTPLTPSTLQLRSWQKKNNFKTYSDDEDEPAASTPKRRKLETTQETNVFDTLRERFENDEISRLKDLAAEQPGYTQFNSNRNRRLANTDVVFQWMFAARFNQSVYRQPCKTSGMKKRLVTKKMIHTALGVSETWLREAEDACGALSIFGPDGTHPDPDVVAQLQLVHGSVELARFLRPWFRKSPPAPVVDLSAE